MTKYHKPSGWKNSEIYFLTVLETRNLKSRCQPGHVPSETYRECLPGLFLTPASVHWLTEAPLQSSIFTLHSAYGHKDTSHIRSGAQPFSYSSSTYTILLSIRQKSEGLLKNSRRGKGEPLVYPLSKDFFKLVTEIIWGSCQNRSISVSRATVTIPLHQHLSIWRSSLLCFKFLKHTYL